MGMTTEKAKRILGRYLIVYVVITAGLFGATKWYKERMYDEGKIREMVFATSSLRDKTDDPCKYSILGDPILAKDEYVKVHLYCSMDAESLNSLDLRAIADRSAGGIIRELGRINGFEIEYSKDSIRIGKYGDNKWRCLENELPITDYGKIIRQKMTINCFYNFSQEQIESKLL